MGADVVGAEVEGAGEVLAVVGGAEDAEFVTAGALLLGVGVAVDDAVTAAWPVAAGLVAGTPAPTLLCAPPPVITEEPPLEPGRALLELWPTVGVLVIPGELDEFGVTSTVGTPGCSAGSIGGCCGTGFGVRPIVQARQSPATSTAPPAQKATPSLGLPSLARRSVRISRPVIRMER